MVKYSSLSEGTLEGRGLYLIEYPKSIPNTDSIHFNDYLFRNYFCIVIQGRVIQEELILSIPLPERALLYR